MLGALVSIAATLAAIGDPVVAAHPPSDDLQLTLSWVAPAGCPTADVEREAIARRAGPLAPDRAREPIVAEVEIRAVGSTFELSMRTRVSGITGERTLGGTDCRQLADAAALVLALLVNPDASEMPAPPPPRPEVAPPVREAPPKEHVPFAAGVGLVAGLGVLPGVAEGVDLRFLVRHGRWEAVARAGGFFPKELNVPVLPGATASFYRLEAALAVCVTAGEGLGCGACVGGALVRLHGESSGVSNPGEASAVWPEALAEVLGHVRASEHVRLRLSIEGRGLAHPPDFAILGLSTVYRPPASSVRGAFAMDVLF